MCATSGKAVYQHRKERRGSTDIATTFQTSHWSGSCGWKHKTKAWVSHYGRKSAEEAANGSAAHHIETRCGCGSEVRMGMGMPRGTIMQIPPYSTHQQFRSGFSFDML